MSNLLDGEVPRSRGDPILLEACPAAEWTQIFSAKTLWPVERSDQLAQIVETEVIPRLMALHRHQSAPKGAKPAGREEVVPTPSDIKMLADRAAAFDEAGSRAIVAKYKVAGVSLVDIFLKLLAPAARRLGVEWENDDRDFAAVTIGLTVLHRVVRGLAPHGDTGSRYGASQRHALLMPVLGEDHTFGVTVVSEVFRHNGWSVTEVHPTSYRDLQTILAGTHADVVGFSVSGAHMLENLKKSIALVRSTTHKDSRRVLVGGSIFEQQPDLLRQLDVDGSGQNASDAVTCAERLVENTRAKG